MIDVETTGPQSGRPVVAQIDADRTVFRVRCGAEVRQCACFEFDHLGLVDL